MEVKMFLTTKKTSVAERANQALKVATSVAFIGACLAIIKGSNALGQSVEQQRALLLQHQAELDALRNAAR